MEIFTYVNTKTGELILSYSVTKPLPKEYLPLSAKEFLLYSKVAIYAVEKYREELEENNA